MSELHRLTTRPSKGDRLVLVATPADKMRSALFTEILVSKAELRRFCWSTLADLEPEEAAAAAAEEGATLEAVCAPAQPAIGEVRELSPGAKAQGLPREGSLSRIGLEALRSGPKTTSDLRLAVPEANDASALLGSLARTGWVQRVAGGGQGSRISWALTAAAEQLLGENKAAAA